MLLLIQRALLTACLSLPLAAFADQDHPIGKIGPNGGLICDTEYALCTSAECTPDPDNPTSKAICDCAVDKGPNYGVLSTCTAREPVDASGTTLLISTYAFRQTPTKDVMTCAGANYWTDCLDAPCVVDPRNPKKAICTCNLIAPNDPAYKDVFLTYGGGCNTKTCQTSYWSGATDANFKAGSDALMKVLGLTEAPFNFCAQKD